MTPYAVLLVRPLNTDDEIRKRFQQLAVHHHPDRDGAGGTPGPLWYYITAAYTAIKTEAKRKALEEELKHSAGVCGTCAGSGVTGRKVVQVCASCLGMGRIRSTKTKKTRWAR